MAASILKQDPRHKRSKQYCIKLAFFLTVYVFGPCKQQRILTNKTENALIGLTCTQQHREN